MCLVRLGLWVYLWYFCLVVASFERVSDEGAVMLLNVVVLWDGKLERFDIFLFVAILLSGIYVLVFFFVVFLLVGIHLVLFELLRGLMIVMVTMGVMVRIGDQLLIVVVVAVIFGLMMFDWVYWWAGRCWGRCVIELFIGNHPKVVKCMYKFEKLIVRWGWVAIVIVYF